MKKTAIIGAGPAGIEAAATLASRGIPVTLFEQSAEPLGNITDKAYLFPNFADARELAANLSQRLQDSNIDMRLNCEVRQMAANDKEGWDINGEHFDIVLMATGYTTFDARRKEELGYGIYPGVITSLEMEKMLRDGRILNSVGETPRRIVFLQCVGSRDEKTGNHYCSKLCCVTAVKQAIEVKKLLPATETFLFYMDLRMWGQGYEEMYRTAQHEHDIRFIRGRISEAGGTFDGRVQIKAEDTLMGIPLKMTTDLLVLMIGMEPSAGTKSLARQCGICTDYGFAQALDPHTGDNLTTHPSLFLAGTCKRPMTLTDAINDGRSAAVRIIETFYPA